MIPKYHSDSPQPTAVIPAVPGLKVCPRVPYAKQDSGRVQYWVIWSLGQRNKFISHPTTAIRQLTFGHKACPALRVSQCQPERTVLSPALQRYFGISPLECLIDEAGMFMFHPIGYVRSLYSETAQVPRGPGTPGKTDRYPE